MGIFLQTNDSISKDKTMARESIVEGPVKNLATDNPMKPRWIVVSQALFVVFLWATSWVFVKIGLHDIPPITFAGLRYFLAFLCLLLVILFNGSQKEIRTLSARSWRQLIMLGVFLYAVTQGAVFVALAYLPAVTVNLLWSFSSVIIALLGALWLAEIPTWLQWGGMTLAVLGAVVYFYPVTITQSQSIGIVVALFGILANAIASIMGRDINRSQKHTPLVVTVISMGVGSLILLTAGSILERTPVITLQNGLIILWLALVNTALAFTLWNHILRTLTAMESSIINGTILIWIAIFAVTLLGENITGKEVVGLAITGIGTLIVQLRKLPKIKIP
jgi:drug/metabolite transporter (DMT)-like permease